MSVYASSKRALSGKSDSVSVAGCAAPATARAVPHITGSAAAPIASANERPKRRIVGWSVPPRKETVNDDAFAASTMTTALAVRASNTAATHAAVAALRARILHQLHAELVAGSACVCGSASRFASELSQRRHARHAWPIRPYRNSGSACKLVRGCEAAHAGHAHAEEAACVCARLGAGALLARRHVELGQVRPACACEASGHPQAQATERAHRTKRARSRALHGQRHGRHLAPGGRIVLHAKMMPRQRRMWRECVPRDVPARRIQTRRARPTAFRQSRWSCRPARRPRHRARWRPGAGR